MFEKVEFECEADIEPFDLTTIFNDPLIMYEGDKFIMDYDEDEVNYIVIRRKK